MYGELGILAYDATRDKVQCHICGRWLRALGNHIRQKHGWTLDDYRDEFQLNQGQSLICAGTREKISEANRNTGNWKYLHSQTMTKDELDQFLASIRPKKGEHKLRLQAIVPRGERLREYNPMNEPEAQGRALSKLYETWYGSPRMRCIARENIRKAIATIRARNLVEERHKCSCGAIFPIREELRSHKKECSLAGRWR